MPFGVSGHKGGSGRPGQSHWVGIITSLWPSAKHEQHDRGNNHCVWVPDPGVIPDSSLMPIKLILTRTSILCFMSESKEHMAQK